MDKYYFFDRGILQPQRTRNLEIRTCKGVKDTVNNPLFREDFFSEPVDIPFEDTHLLGSAKIREYLQYRYGNYMQLPPEDKRDEHMFEFLAMTDEHGNPIR